MPRKIINNELKEEIKNFYLSMPMSYDEVSKKYDLSLPTIGKILKDTKKYTKAKINNPNANERFFENIDTEEKAYFLGLLISDGNVFKDNSGRQASISITLDLQDEYILERFKKLLNINTSIVKDGRGCGQIAIRSDLMAEDLKKYGVVPRKSHITYLPIIDKKYMPHLIRGILDGDGSILAKSHLNKDGRERFLHSISFCGTHKLMEDIANYIFEELNLKQHIQVYDYQDKDLSEIHIQNYEDMAKLGCWMYTHSTIYLNRKIDIFNKFLIHYYGLSLKEYDNTELTY